MGRLTAPYSDTLLSVAVLLFSLFQGGEGAASASSGQQGKREGRREECLTFPILSLQATVNLKSKDQYAISAVSEARIGERADDLRYHQHSLIVPLSI